MRKTEILKKIAQRRREKDLNKSDSMKKFDEDMLRCASLGSAGINILAGLTSLFGQFPMPGSPTLYNEQKMF